MEVVVVIIVIVGLMLGLAAPSFGGMGEDRREILKKE